MAEITEDQQIGFDLDWFATDVEGRIAHFASGGTLLPRSVARSRENLDQLLEFFGSVAKWTDYVVSPNFENRMDIRLIPDMDRYLRSYAEMSSKGLYSYDVSEMRHTFRPYFLITVPHRPLMIDDVPSEIRMILNNVRMEKVSFDRDEFISESLITSL
jgi:hypothetical protein